MSYAVYTQVDYSKEKSSTTIHTADITAATFDAYNTESDQMRNAIDGITIGTMAEETIVSEKNDISAVYPTNVNAHRERKWKVNYVGQVRAKKYFVTLPCADPTARLQTNSDFALLSQTEIAAFITRFESFAKCPDDQSEAVTVVSIQLVGRNL
jgi:hypothetical protein